MLKKLKILSTLAVLAVTLSALAAPVLPPPTNPPPAKVQLSWDPPSVSIARVSVYYGDAPRAYTNVLTVAATSTVATITLPRGATYYFAGTFVDGNGLESDYSGEVSYTPAIRPSPPNFHPLVILQVQSSQTANGKFADAGMDWTLAPDQANSFFKLKLVSASNTDSQALALKLSPTERARRAVRAVTMPPLPSKL